MQIRSPNHIQYMNQIGKRRRDGSNRGQNTTLGGTVTSTGDNSVDLITTIDGNESSYFNSKRVINMQLEQKDD